jgi:hypothetical protein
MFALDKEQNEKELSITDTVPAPRRCRRGFSSLGRFKLMVGLFSLACLAAELHAAQPASGQHPSDNDPVSIDD